MVIYTVMQTGQWPFVAWLQPTARRMAPTSWGTWQVLYYTRIAKSVLHVPPSPLKAVNLSPLNIFFKMFYELLSSPPSARYPAWCCGRPRPPPSPRTAGCSGRPTGPATTERSRRGASWPNATTKTWGCGGWWAFQEANTGGNYTEKHFCKGADIPLPWSKDQNLHPDLT